MAIIPWHKSVQKKQTLTYAVSPKFGGKWTTMVDPAVAEFNRQMTTLGIKLTLRPVEEGKGPHIIFETEAGHGLHGRAPSQTKRINGVEYLDEVRIVVPATPRVNPDDPKSREIGSGVRLVLLVHELIHAVGLSNDEHSKDDVFAAKTVLVPKRTYVKGVQLTEDVAQPHDGSDPMPPVRIGAATLALLKKAWHPEEVK